MQTPLTQLGAIGVQTMPQPPQLLASDAASISQPSAATALQSRCPAVHTQFPAAHCVSTTQSLLLMQPPPSGHGEQLPPQSMPVSLPSCMPFEQLATQVPLLHASEQH